MSLSTDLTVIIPVLNRGDLIHYTLESVRRASLGLAVQTLVVDDGSTPPAADSIRALGFMEVEIVRQENRGLLFARLAGLAHARGRHVLFLDSDDLVGPEKLRRQIAALDHSGAEVSYTDSARTALAGGYDRLEMLPDAPLENTRDGPTFFIRVQPAPHSPVFRTDFLRRVVAEACFPPSPLYNPVAEIWFYHNAAVFPSTAVKVDGPHTIVGFHPGTRLTNHWERLGIASLAVMEAFARTCPDLPTTVAARQLVAEKAFGAWRRLPRGFSREFDDRLLGVWRRLDRRRDPAALGGRGFRAISRLLGPERAGRLFRRLRNGTYASCRTMPDAEVARLMSLLPAGNAS